MKTLYRFVCAAILFAVVVQEIFAWGQKGHDVVSEVAARHLKCKVRKGVRKVLDGYSILYWSNWLDNASHTEAYAYTKTWHYKNIDEGETFENALLEPKGDIVGAIKMQIETLSDKSISKEQRATALKMLVHLMGDLHQPMHMGRRSDRGGNQFAVTYFNRKANLHGIWDSAILEDGHKWSHTEWADEIDLADKAAMKEICQGTIEDWARETHLLAKRVYAETPQNENLSYDYVAKWTPIIEQQLLKGGLRLAFLLNKLF